MTGNETVRVYEELAELEEKRGSAQARDRFLMLAGDAALSAGLTDEAEGFRRRLLEHNPHHLVKPYPSLAEALKSSDVFSYVADLRKSYPPEDSAKLLASMKESDKEKDGASKSEALSATVSSSDVSDSEAPTQAGYLFTMPRPPAPSRPEAPSEPPPARRIEPIRPVPAPLPEKELDSHERDEHGAAGALISDGLFYVVLLAGVVLTGYTLLRPFLPIVDAPFR